MKLRIAALALGAMALVGGTNSAQAALALTQAGIDDGFTLTTFVGPYNLGNYGPLAQGVLPNGKIITGSVGDRKIYVFNDVDNQALGNAISATPYSCQTGNCNFAMATAGGQVYGAQLFGGTYLKFANDGSSAPIPGLNLTNFLGMWGNPVNGHLISASNSGLVDIDPVAGTFRVINASLFPDGVSVSPDGKIAYIEQSGNILAIDILTGIILDTYNGQGRGPDGTGVITGGKFDGFIVVNNNDGTVGLIDPAVGTQEIIAAGGSRGDFVSPDLNNGTLFLSQVEQVVRLSCGDGCSIGGPPPTDVPEPATLALLGGGLLGIGMLRRRRSA